MELEKQVCSLKLARRLKTLHVKQSSLYVWWYTEAMATDVKYFPDQDWDKREWSLRPRTASMKDSGRDVAAFTVAELGEKLKETNNNNPMPYWNGSQWEARINDLGLHGHHYMSADTEADARAKMLIYLLEHKLV
jgi:hypothetical protein